MEIKRTSGGSAFRRFGVPAVLSAQLATLVVALVALVAGWGRTNSRGNSNDGRIDVGQLVDAASEAFSAGNDELGVDLLSAALVARPNDGRALDLYAGRLEQRFEKALKDRDWDVAEIQIAAYDSAVRDGLRNAHIPTEVKELGGRKRTLVEWNGKLSEYAGDLIADISSALKTADQTQLVELESQIRGIPADRLTASVRGELAFVVQHLIRRRNEAQQSELQKRLLGIREKATAKGVSTTDLRELRVSAEKLHAEVVEVQLDGGEATKLLAGARDTLSQLDQSLQVRSIRQMQTISDAEANEAMNEARKRFEEYSKLLKVRNATWQSCGEKLAEAELYLARVDRLASVAVQQKVRDLSNRIKRSAIYCRAEQKKAYNLWAIGQLEESISDFKKATGIFNDDETKFIPHYSRDESCTNRTIA